MTQKKEEHKALIQRLEAEAEANPSLYKMRIVGLAVLGYAYIGFVLVVLTALVGVALLLLIKLPFLAIKLGLPLLAVIGLMVKACYIKFPSPKGMPLKKSDVPGVYQTIQEIRRAVGGPPIDKVLLVPEFNAAIVQRPRLGIFGWHENYLLLGMPLLQALSYDQFKAVLAHEMGHLSGNHGKFTSWVYSVRVVWSQLLIQLQETESFAKAMLVKFFLWYSPLFDAYSFVLARAQEYQADRCAADVVGKQTAAEALICTEIKAQLLSERYWQQIYERAKSEPEPPCNAFSGLPERIANSAEKRDLDSFLELSLGRMTDYDNTHPCLKDRVAHLLSKNGEQASTFARMNLEEIVRNDDSAAQAMFANKLEFYLKVLDNDWRNESEQIWKHCYEKVQQANKELEKLLEKRMESPLDSDDLLMLARNTGGLRSLQEAQAFFDEGFERFPEDGRFWLAYGSLLLDDKEEKGIEYVNKAMELDPILTIDGCQTLYGYLKSVNKHEEADAAAETAQAAVADVVAAQHERNGIDDSSQYEPHGLPADKVDEIAKSLATHSNLVCAHFVQKKLKHFPEHKLYILAIQVKWQPLGNEEAISNLIHQIIVNTKFPMKTLIYRWDQCPPRYREYAGKDPTAHLVKNGQVCTSVLS